MLGRLAQLGLSNQQVDQALAAVIGGQTVTEFQPTGAQQEDITLMAASPIRYSLTALEQIPIGVQSGSNTCRLIAFDAVKTAAPRANPKRA